MIPTTRGWVGDTSNGPNRTHIRHTDRGLPALAIPRASDSGELPETDGMRVRVQGSFDCFAHDDRLQGPLAIVGIYTVSIYYVSRNNEGVPMPSAQIVKWGNSLAVRIPKPVAEAAGVREGDAIVIEAAAGEISFRRKQRIPTLKELVAQITPENRYSETPTGAARGKERVEW